MAIEIRLKEVMKEKGISGRKLAEMLGSQPQYISNICNGRQNMSLDMLKRISDLLGIQLWELLVDPKDMSGDGDFVAMVRRKGEMFFFESETKLMDALKEWESDKEENPIQ